MPRIIDKSPFASMPGDSGTIAAQFGSNLTPTDPETANLIGRMRDFRSRTARPALDVNAGTLHGAPLSPIAQHQVQGVQSGTLPGYQATNPAARRVGQEQARWGVNPVADNRRSQATAAAAARIPQAMENMQTDQLIRRTTAIPQPGVANTAGLAQGRAGAYDPNAIAPQGEMGPTAPPQRVLDQRARLQQMYGPNVTTADQAIRARAEQRQQGRTQNRPLSANEFQSFQITQSGKDEARTIKANQAIVKSYRDQGYIPETFSDEALGAISEGMSPAQIAVFLERFRPDAEKNPLKWMNAPSEKELEPFLEWPQETKTTWYGKEYQEPKELKPEEYIGVYRNGIKKWRQSRGFEPMDGMDGQQQQAPVIDHNAPVQGLDLDAIADEIIQSNPNISDDQLRQMIQQRVEQERMSRAGV